MQVDEYLSGPEELTRRELIWGEVREPPAPLFGHQSIIGCVYVLLQAYVRPRDLGTVIVSPIDVVLDANRALIVQPDVVFIQKARESIIKGQVWGPPDLAVEVASRQTALYDRTTKMSWYRHYGVRECWLVRPDRRDVGVVDLGQQGRAAFQWFTGDEILRSTVLTGIDLPAGVVFE
jgi:Uma2 family endonuclease